MAFFPPETLSEGAGAGFELCLTGDCCRSGGLHLLACSAPHSPHWELHPGGAEWWLSTVACVGLLFFLEIKTGASHN